MTDLVSRFQGLELLLAQVGQAVLELKQEALLAVGSGAIPEPAQPTGPTIYNQRDDQWSGDKIAGTFYTIGVEGCLMTDMASILTDAGCKINPRQLNAWLMTNNGYVIKKGHSSFVFAATDKLGVTKFRTIAYCPSKPAPMALLNQTVKDGNFAIVQIKVVSGGNTYEHWMRYLGDDMVMDPYYGDIISIVDRYKRYSNAAEAIIGYAIYDKTLTKG